MQGALDAPAAIRPALRRGFFGGLRVLFFGERQEELGGKDHGAWIRHIARGIALPLMFLFSFGALMQLAGDAIKSDISIVIKKGWGKLDFVSVFSTFIVLALIFGMDIVMVKHALSLRDKRSLNKPWNECLDDLFFVLFIGAIEGITYGMLLAAQENPHTLQQWLMVILRAAAAPLVAIDLAMTGDRVPTKDEMKNSLAVEVGGAMRTIFQNIRLGSLTLKDLPVLYPLFGHLLGGYSHADKQSDDLLMDRINAVMPGAVDAMAKEEVTKAQQERDQGIKSAQEYAKEQLNSMQRQLDTQRLEYTRKVPAAILSIISGAEWPDWLLQEYPELAAMDLTKALKAPRKASASTGGTSARVSPTNELEAILVSLDVNPRAVAKVWKQDASTEQKVYKEGAKLRGIWITTDDLIKMSDGSLVLDDARSITVSHGEGYKAGLTYAAPARATIQVLSRRNQLHSSLLEWWSKQQKEVKVSEEQGE